MRKVVIMIIDSNPFSRAGLRHTLSQQSTIDILDILECEPGEDGQEALLRIAESSPDVVLLDIDYPSTSGLDLGKKITRNYPGTKVVVLSSNPYDNDDELFEAIKTGSVAYLRSKHCNDEDLITTIRQASNGEYPINDIVNSRPRVARRVLRQFQDIASMGRAVEEISAPLTPKEIQVLTLIAEGNSNKQIANILGISDQTIKNHVSAILRKINANYRAHAVFIAIRDGLISIQPNSNTQ
ncbi:MAG: response regulator transcription factor [Chloroflexota bacterium]|nr:response regulator transcription factor [Chloroflexota bacterium]